MTDPPFPYTTPFRSPMNKWQPDYRPHFRSKAHDPDLYRHVPHPAELQLGAAADANRLRLHNLQPPTHRPATFLARHGRDPRGSPGRSRSEEHTSELQSLMRISYAVFCLNKKKT